MIISFSRRFAALVGAACCFAPALLFGAELKPLWELGAGIGTLTMPDYRGSDEQRNYVFPIPYFVYRGDIIQVDRERIRGLLFKTDRLELDFSISGSAPAESDDNKAREGMSDLDPTLEIGPRLNVLLHHSENFKLTFLLPVRTVIAVDTSLDSARNIGWIANPILNFDILNIGPGGGWNLGLSGGPLWADKSYHDYFYGVKPAFATSQRPSYEAASGYSGSQFTVSLSKRFAKTWIGAFVRWYDLHGASFEDSPLLERETAFMAGFGVAWIFAQSSQRVMAED